MKIIFEPKQREPYDFDSLTVKKDGAGYRLYVDGAPVSDIANLHLEVRFNAALPAIQEAAGIQECNFPWDWAWCTSIDDELAEHERFYNTKLAKEQEKWERSVRANMISLVSTLLLMVGYIVKLLH